MHLGGFELTKLNYYTRLEDNLIRHRGDRLPMVYTQVYRLGPRSTTFAPGPHYDLPDPGYITCVFWTDC